MHIGMNLWSYFVDNKKCDVNTLKKNKIKDRFKAA